MSKKKETKMKIYWAIYDGGDLQADDEGNILWTSKQAAEEELKGAGTDQYPSNSQVVSVVITRAK